MMYITKLLACLMELNWTYLADVLKALNIMLEKLYSSYVELIEVENLINVLIATPRTSTLDEWCWVSQFDDNSILS